MKKIEVRAGYYEWHLFIDDELVYVFSDSVNENFETRKELKAFISELMRCLDDEAREDDDSEYCMGFCDYYGKRQEMKELWLSLTFKERNKVEKALYNAWLRYCD